MLARGPTARFRPTWVILSEYLINQMGRKREECFHHEDMTHGRGDDCVQHDSNGMHICIYVTYMLKWHVNMHFLMC